MCKSGVQINQEVYDALMSIEAKDLAHARRTLTELKKIRDRVRFIIARKEEHKISNHKLGILMDLYERTVSRIENVKGRFYSA